MRSRRDPRDRGRTKAGRIIRLVAGWSLVVGGLILAIPFVPGPGVVLFIFGVGLLSSESRFVRRVLRQLREWRLMRRAMREAARAGVRFDLDDEEDEQDGSGSDAGAGSDRQADDVVGSQPRRLPDRSRDRDP